MRATDCEADIDKLLAIVFCFNQNHAVNECNLPRRECSNKIVKAFKDKKGRERKVGEVCNAPHNIFLCKQRAFMEAAAEN